jgi:hypothetical protein
MYDNDNTLILQFRVPACDRSGSLPRSSNIYEDIGYVDV